MKNLNFKKLNTSFSFKVKTYSKTLSFNEVFAFALL